MYKSKNVLLVLLCVYLVIFIAGCGGAKTDAASSTVNSSAASTDCQTAAFSTAVTVRHTAGSVVLLRDSRERSFSGDGELNEGDEILTGSDGLVILKLQGGKQIQVAADSRLVVTRLKGGDGSEQVVLTLHRGNVISVIHDKLDGNDSYEVETPGLIMAIRGTVASVSYDADTLESHVAFFEGSGVVSSKMAADVVEVSAGEGVKMVDGKLVRGDLEPDELQDNEQQFLYDEDYYDFFDNGNSDRIAARIDFLMKKQAFIEARKRYNNRFVLENITTDDSGEGTNGINGGTDAHKNGFWAIQQAFEKAKIEYNRGVITKQEFLKVKQEYILAKKNYYRD